MRKHVWEKKNIIFKRRKLISEYLNINIHIVYIFRYIKSAHLNFAKTE